MGQLPLAQSTVSQHLAVLKAAGLVRTELSWAGEAGSKYHPGLASACPI